jgi:hypothetical protein
MLLLLPLLSRMIHSQEGLVTYLTSAIDSHLGITIVCINQPGFNPNTKESCRLRQAANLDMYSTKYSCCCCCNEEIASKEKQLRRRSMHGMHRHSFLRPSNNVATPSWERHREPISNVINSKQANGRDPC